MEAVWRQCGGSVEEPLARIKKINSVYSPHAPRRLPKTPKRPTSCKDLERGLTKPITDSGWQLGDLQTEDEDSVGTTYTDDESDMERGQ